jgi:hypothetical protein
MESPKIPYSPGLSVPDDQLSLSAADGHQTVDGLDPCLHGLSHGDSGNDAGGFGSYSRSFGRSKGTLTTCNYTV